MKETISQGIETFNKSTIALKNVLWFFVILVAAVLSWANIDSHLSDNDIHLTPEMRKELIILLDDFDELVERVEKKDKRINKTVDDLKKELKEIHK